MNKLIRIEDRELERISYKGVIVLPLCLVDALHKRPEGTARHVFRKNTSRFLDEQDYFKVPYKTWSTFPNAAALGLKSPRLRTLLTESGYLLLVRYFRGDYAVQIQRAIMNNYFFKEGGVEPAKESRQISLERYVELLEAENALLKLKH